MKLSPHQAVLLEATLDRMGLPTVQEVLENKIDYGKQEVSILGNLAGEAVCATVPDASVIEWERVHKNLRVMKGKPPPEALSFKE